MPVSLPRPDASSSVLFLVCPPRAFPIRYIIYFKREPHLKNWPMRVRWERDDNGRDDSIRIAFRQPPGLMARARHGPLSALFICEPSSPATRFPRSFRPPPYIFDDVCGVPSHVCQVRRLNVARRY